MWTSALLGCLVALTGCSAVAGPSVPSASTGTPAGDLVDGNRLRPERVQALRAEIDALDPVGQQRRVADLDLAIERELWTLSGLEQKLGGPAAADAAYAKANAAGRAALLARLGPMRAPVSFGKSAVAAPVDDLADADGASVFGGLMFASVAAGVAAGLVDGSSTGSQTQGGVTRSATKEGGGVYTSTRVEQDGIRVEIELGAGVQACPYATGRVEAGAHVWASASQDGTGFFSTFEVTTVLQVGDDAEVTGSTDEVVVRQSEYRTTGQRFVDISVSSDGSSYVKQTSGLVTRAFTESSARAGVLMGRVLVNALRRAAETKWKSGACVVLNPTVSAGPSGLAPSSTVQILAPPRAKIDGAPTGGTVTATLSGAGALEPASTRVPADATYTYRAPNEAQQVGTVTVEARSKRGIGKATLRFDTIRCPSPPTEVGSSTAPARSATCASPSPSAASGTT